MSSINTFLKAPVNDSPSTLETPPPTTKLRYEADHRFAQVLLPVMAIIFGCGICLLAWGQLAGLYLSIVFGIVVAALVIQILPGSCYLEIDPEKLTICTQFKARHYYWADVKELGLKNLGYFEVVGLRLLPQRVKKYGLKYPASKGEWDIMINNRYDLPSQELVKQLNLVRNSMTTQL